MYSWRGYQVAWMVGDENANGTFVPESTGAVDYGGYYASASFELSDGRRIVWAWVAQNLQANPSPPDQPQPCSPPPREGGEGSSPLPLKHPEAMGNFAQAVACSPAEERRVCVYGVLPDQ